MAKSPEITRTVERINALRKTDAAAAADLARASWRMLDQTKLSSDPSIAEARGEFSYAESVARRSAIKRSFFLPTVVHHLREGITNLWENGPLSVTPEDARVRGNIWDQSFGGLEIQQIILQEVFYFLDLLRTIDDHEDLQSFYAGVLRMLAILHEEYGTDRFGEIFIIKTVTDTSLIKDAYTRYLARIKEETWTQDQETAYIHRQVLTKSFGRDWSLFKTAREHLGISRKNAVLSSLKEKGKGVTQKFFQLGWKIQNTLAKIRGFDAHRATDVDKLLRQRQLGLGENKVRELF